MQDKSISRAGFLKGAGVVTVLVAGGQACVKVDGEAYRPWQDWRAGGPGALGLIPPAILAANPHNTQPWKFRVADRRIDVFADLSRSLGAMDPFHREMYLGLGCALENMMLAARAGGYGTTLRLMPSPGREDHVATLVLRPGQAGPDESELYQMIPKRHTDRGPYDTERPLEPATLARLGAAADTEPRVNILFFDSGESKRRLGDLINRSTEVIIADPQMTHDGGAWGPRTGADVEKYRDGITLPAQGLPDTMIFLGGLFPVSEEEGNKFWRDATRDRHVATAAALGVIAVPNKHDRALTLRAGRVWQRMHLQAAALGVSLQPLNQPAEVADREEQLQRTPDFGPALDELTAEAGQTTFVFRAGYGIRTVYPSPRRSVDDVLES